MSSTRIMPVRINEKKRTTFSGEHLIPLLSDSPRSGFVSVKTGKIYPRGAVVYLGKDVTPEMMLERYCQMYAGTDIFMLNGWSGWPIESKSSDTTLIARVWHHSVHSLLSTNVMVILKTTVHWIPGPGIRKHKRPGSCHSCGLQEGRFIIVMNRGNRRELIFKTALAESIQLDTKAD